MKLTITFQTGSLIGRNWDLTEGFLTVGRGSGCNIIFDRNTENMVSTKHAYFETKPDGFYLIDSKSTNGTFVNGQRIQICKINSGDNLQFGRNGPQAMVFLESDEVSQDLASIATVQSSPMSQPTVPGELFENVRPIPVNQQFVQPAFVEPVLPQAPNFQNSMSFIGLSNPAVKVEPEKSKVGVIIGAIAAVAIFGVLGLLSAGIIASEVGLVTAIVATIIAFIPPVIYVLPLILLDRYDPEPPWLIASAFAWGGVVATFFSIIVNTILGFIAGGVMHSPFWGQIFSIVVSAPVFEELFKGIGVLLILLFFRREFDDILDGIVFGGVVGLGFATVENILYYGRGVNDGTIGALILVRGIMSPFIHSTFTAMTGIGCGIARESHKKLVRFLAPIGGYIGAVVLHMGWNGGIGVLSSFILGPAGFWISYVVVGIPFFIIFIGFCIWTMRRQNRILREMLAIDTARGLISQDQMETATSAFSSTGWLLGGIASGKFFSRWKFLRAVGKLGLSYWHIQRATAAHGQTGSFQSNPMFRAEVEKWRDKV